MNFCKTFIIGFFLFLTACSPPIKIELIAARQLNQDDYGHSLPVAVVLYQLRDNQAFANANFQELWQNDRDVLADSFLEKRVVNVAPGSHVKLNWIRDKEMKFIAAMAIFRNPGSDQWRVSKDVGKSLSWLSRKIEIDLKANRITESND